MITQELCKSLAKFQTAQQAIKKAVLDRMAQLARHLDLDKIVITSHGRAYYYIGDESLQSRAIDEVRRFYEDHIDSQGIWGVWTRKDGWSV
jgi:hypothetical protein